MSTKSAGRVVAITGAARGIGFATAKELIERGARVAIGDVDEVALRDAERKLGGRAKAAPLDVTSAESFEHFIAFVEKELGPLDVLINNAGIMPVGPTIDEEEKTAKRILEINTLGVITGTKLALRSMLPRGRGHIINVSSTAGVSYHPGAATYCASKYAVIGFTDAVRMELHGRGIEFTTILPAFTNTDLIAGTKGLRGVENVEPEDVAREIANSVERPTRRVYVPRSLGAMLGALRLFPASFAESVGRSMGTDRVFLDVDSKTRSAYDRRVKGLK
ncbi:MAG: SDR family oxidoreductase [Polyangiaceae bacterium]|nr:SDR family oxidoreductase [Polyangiaceae bacterium]